MDACTVIRRLGLVVHHMAPDVDELAGMLARALDRLDHPARRAVVRHVYWRMPEVPVTALRLALGGDAPLRTLAGRGPVIGSCRGCGGIVRGRTRDPDPPGAVRACPTCAASHRCVSTGHARTSMVAG